MDSQEKELKKELLANRLEIIIRDAVDSFEKWRSNCGTSGWYDMPTEHTRAFIQQLVIDSAKAAITTYRPNKEQEPERSVANTPNSSNGDDNITNQKASEGKNY